MNAERYSKERFANIKEYREDKFNLKKVYILMKHYVNNKKGKKLLDIGCADGSFAALLQKRFGFDSYGIDISPKVVKRARLNGIKARVGNLSEKLPYKKCMFDVVIMCEVIEHIFDTDFLLNEVYRVMKKNGLLFITTPNVASFTSRVKLIFGGYPNGLEYCLDENSNGHIRAYTPHVLRRQLFKHNFTMMKLTSPNFLFPVKSRLIPDFIKQQMIYFSDLTGNLGEQIVAVAKK